MYDFDLFQVCAKDRGDGDSLATHSVALFESRGVGMSRRCDLSSMYVKGVVRAYVSRDSPQ